MKKYYKTFGSVIYLYYLCTRNKEEQKMTQTLKYSVGRSGSGWGVWDANGNKIKGFGSRGIDRFAALKYMYMLYGWDWNRSKYVRQDPYLANLAID